MAQDLTVIQQSQLSKLFGVQLMETCTPNSTEHVGYFFLSKLFGVQLMETLFAIPGHILLDFLSKLFGVQLMETKIKIYWRKAANASF